MDTGKGQIKAIATGWGKTETGKSAQHLMQVDMKILPQSKCDGDVILCAKGKPKGATAPGDSGGPLVVKKNGKWFVFGVTSYGPKHNNGTLPSAYARVSRGLAFIKDAMKGKIK